MYIVHLFRYIGRNTTKSKKRKGSVLQSHRSKEDKNSAMFLLLVSGNSLNFNLSIGGDVKNNLTFLLSVASDGPSFGQMRFNPTEPRGPLQ